MYRDSSHRGPQAAKDGDGLTQTQRDLLAFIVEKIRETGFGPSIREMMEKFDWRSTNAPESHLIALEGAGKIIRQEHRGRMKHRHIDLVAEGLVVEAGKKGVRVQPPRRWLTREEARRLAALLLEASSKTGGDQ